MDYLDEFNKVEEENAKASLNLEEMDEAVKLMARLKADYEAKKQESNKAETEYKNQRFKVLELLETAKKTKYYVDGIGTVSTVEKLSVSTPKGLEDKKKLLEWLQSKGEDFYLTYATVNHQSLNGLYTLMMDQAALEGETVTIPGVDLPTSMKDIRFRKA